MTRWLVTPYDRQGVTEAVIVKHDDELVAARVGLRILQDHWADTGSEDRIDNVFITEWDERTAYTAELTVGRSQLQCCGGGPEFEYVGHGGHWATCPEGGHNARSE